MWKILNQVVVKNRSYQSIVKLNSLNTLNAYRSNKVLSQNLTLRNQSTTPKQETDSLNKTPLNKPPTGSSADKSNKSSASQNTNGSFKKLLMIFTSGAVAYFAISYYLENRQSNNKTGIINYSSKNLPGRVVPSKSLNRGKNPGNIKITLYQYVTCPFCCKVRAYLDYFGYTYDIVEVNSVNKNQLDWSGYKKVPTLAIQLPSNDGTDKYDEQIIQLNDSSVIVSALETFRLDPNTPLVQVNKFYEPTEIDLQDKSKSTDFINKYFVMLHNDKMSDGKTTSERKDEREWRKWVDSKFIHVISPNVYRTMNEALAAFNWFDKAGDWQSHFSSFERTCVIYLGSFVMYFLGKSLKKKHNLKEDVRISLYDLCDEWVTSLNGTFRGGSKPNLADLALYGSMGSFEGCQAFKDMMENTKIRHWYESCKDQVDSSKGGYYLNNPTKENTEKPSNSNENQEPKKKKKFFIF